MKLPSIGITKTILKLKDKKRRKQAYQYLQYYLDDLSKGLLEARLSLCENNKLSVLLSDYIKLGYDNWEIPELDLYGDDRIFYLFGEGDGYECVFPKYSSSQTTRILWHEKRPLRGSMGSGKM